MYWLHLLDKTPIHTDRNKLNKNLTAIYFNPLLYTRYRGNKQQKEFQQMKFIQQNVEFRL